MAGGKWVFALQFRRQLMVLLDSFWLVTSGRKPGWADLCKVEQELLLLSAGLAFLEIDFRARSAEVVTVSDASEQGGGSCVGRSLTPMGLAALSHLDARSTAWRVTKRAHRR